MKRMQKYAMICKFVLCVSFFVWIYNITTCYVYNRRSGAHVYDDTDDDIIRLQTNATMYWTNTPIPDFEAKKKKFIEFNFKIMKKFDHHRQFWIKVFVRFGSIFDFQKWIATAITVVIKFSFNSAELNCHSRTIASSFVECRKPKRDGEKKKHEENENLSSL